MTGESNGQLLKTDEEASRGQKLGAPPRAQDRDGW